MNTARTSCMTAALLCVLAACADPAPDLAVHIRTEYVMGTLLSIRVEAADSATAETAVDTAFAVVRHLDRTLSNYDPGSEISRIALNAPEPVPVSPETFEFVRRTLEFAASSGGAMNPTIGPVVELWGFYGDTPGIPDSAAIRATLTFTDYRRVLLDDSAGSLGLGAGMQFDPGATGKGYALEQAAMAASAVGARTVYFDFGGQLYRLGTEPATTAVRHPRHDSIVVSTLSFASGSLSTSGDYERYFEHDGTRYAHIIDPRTGYPVAGRAAVTVFAPEPFTADALSTALFVLGPDRGRTLLDAHPGSAALFAEWQGDSLVYSTAGPWADLEEP